MDLSWFAKAPRPIDEYASDIVLDPARERLVRTMVELFTTQGYSAIKARLVGSVAPPLLQGTHRDHRPDVSGVWSPTNKPFMCDVVMPGAVDDPALESRLTILQSAARLYGAELHFACPNVRLKHDRGSMGEWLRRRLGRSEIIAKVWEI